MNDQRRIVQLLTDWLEDQPSRAPDPLLESVLADLPRTRQRARWRFALRSFPMFGSTSPRFSIAIVAAALFVVAAIGLWGRLPLVGPGVEGSPTPAAVWTAEPSPDPTPVPTREPTEAPTPTLTGAPTPAPGPWQIIARSEDTALAPGTWSTADSFPVRVSFAVPDGWMGWYATRSHSVIFRSDEDGEDAGVGIYFAFASNIYADPCRFAEVGLLSPAVGPSVDDLVTALLALPEADVSPPTEITVDGYRGMALTITAPESFEGCSPLLPQYRIIRLPNGNSTWMEPGEMQRMSILDVDGTRLVIVTWEWPDPGPQERAELQQVFDSIRLEPADSD